MSSELPGNGLRESEATDTAKENRKDNVVEHKRNVHPCGALVMFTAVFTVSYGVVRSRCLRHVCGARYFRGVVGPVKLPNKSRHFHKPQHQEMLTSIAKRTVVDSNRSLVRNRR